MKNISNNLRLFLIVVTFSLICPQKAEAQIEQANIIIDSVNTVFKSNLSFPYWLKSGQTINVGPNTSSISVLEFIIDTLNGNNLKFSQALNIKTTSKVPNLRTWKIESVGFLDNAIVGSKKPLQLTSPLEFTNPGSYTWNVPIDVSRICVEVWGAGGNGATGNSSGGGNGYGGGGGGSGGYGFSCFTVNPGTTYIVSIGTVNNNSSFGGTLIYATSGANGNGINGGAGGISNGKILNINGENGKPGVSTIGLLSGGDGGTAPNGGTNGQGGGKSYCFNGVTSIPCASTSGLSPGSGGGGGGAATPSGFNGAGSSGGNGKVIIYW